MTQAIAQKPYPHWITPKEQLDRLQLPSEALHMVSSAETIRQLVLDYIYAPKTNHWYNVLQDRKLLPLYIPPLPSNIDQILSSLCPIFAGLRKPDDTHYTINETHSLFLAPAGSVYQLIAGDPKATTLFSHVKNNMTETAGDNADILLIEEPTWMLGLKELLPDSTEKTYAEQEKMIEELQNTTGIHYTFPNLKYAFAFSCLSLSSERLQHTVTPTYTQETRVVEPPSQKTYDNISHRLLNLTVGIYSHINQITTPYVQEVYKIVPYPSVGIRPIWINFSPMPPPLSAPEPSKCCTLL